MAGVYIYIYRHTVDDILSMACNVHATSRAVLIFLQDRKKGALFLWVTDPQVKLALNFQEIIKVCRFSTINLAIKF